MTANLKNAKLSVPATPLNSWPLNSQPVMVWLCLTASAIYAWPPLFRVLPAVILSGSAEAAWIGLISMMASLGGFLGPSVFGYLLSAGYSSRVACAVLSMGFVGGAAALLGARLPAGERK